MGVSVCKCICIRAFVADSVCVCLWFVAKSSADGLALSILLEPATPATPATHLANALGFTIQFKCDSMCECCVANTAIGCRRSKPKNHIQIQVQIPIPIPVQMPAAGVDVAQK